MARRERSVSQAQRLASLAVLAVLCALTAWLLSTRGQLNPAVEVALRAPALKAAAGQAGASTAFSNASSDASSGAPSDTAATQAAAEPGAPAGARPASLAALLPVDAPGLKSLTQAEVFTPATLSDKIDGKAELYLAAGFAGMACRSYQAGSARIDLYLYRMKTPDGAFAVFSGQRRPGAAQSPLAKNGYLTENALFLTHGADYIEVIADRAGAKPALEALAKAVLAGLGGGKDEGGKPGQTDRPDRSGRPGRPEDIQPGDLFPKAGLKADSLRLTVADAFGFQGFANVYTADYDASMGGGTALVARRKDAAEAKKAAQAYQRFLTDNGYAVQTQAALGAGAPAGAVVLVMDGSVEILLVRGNVLAGVHDAPDLASALKLANALAASLDVSLDVSLGAALKARGLDK